MRRVATTIGVMALSAVVAAQQPSAPAFRSATDLVQVDVVVHDKAGRFVADLTAADFEVKEEGKVERVEFFDLVGATAPAPSAAQRPSPVEPTTTAPSATSPPPPPRIFVVVFDDTHLSPGGFIRTKAAAVSLFSKSFRDGDIGGVVIDGQMVNNRLTTTREELLQAIEKARPNSKTNSRLVEEREWPRMTETEGVRIAAADDQVVMAAVYNKACADDPDLCARVDIRPNIRQKAQRFAGDARVASEQTLRSLGALFNGLARLDGRKSVLLLSEGFVAEQSWPLVQTAVGMAARANARIYTLDARGLDRTGMANRLGGTDPGDDAMSRLLAQLDFGADSVNSLAVDTGGFVVRNTNFFDQAIEQIARDAGTYYVLGYAPGREPDGKYRRIAVSVKRPGLTIRARKGYVASPKSAAPTAGASPSSTATAPSATASSGAPAAATDVPGPSPTTPAAASMAPAAREGAALSAAESGPAPAVVASRPVASAEPMVPTPSPSALRMRPDGLKHANALAAGETPDAAARAGWEAYQRGDLERARASLATATASPGARPWAHYALGQAAYGLRQFGEAVRAWERVQAAAPEFEPVYFDLVDGYLQLKEYDKAIGLLRAAEKRWPKDAEVYSALGVVQVNRGALDDAVKSFETVLGLTPNDSTAYFNLGRALEMRYVKSRRYNPRTRVWTYDDHDRAMSAENYKRAVALGGPLAASAREGLQRLDWEK